MAPKDVNPVEMMQRIAPDDAANLTVDVDAFCSWSACKMKILSNAFAKTLLILYFSAGTQTHLHKIFGIRNELSDI